MHGRDDPGPGSNKNELERFNMNYGWSRPLTLRV
jgi:hypothetical protein